MARARTIRVTDVSSGETVWLRRGPDGAAVGADAAETADEHIALVPADRTAVLAVDLPPLNTQRQQQALRWAIEDRIAGAAEAQHVVALGRRDDGRLDCLVVARDDMRGWLDALPAPPDRIVPDAACLPRRAGETTLMPFGDSILVASGSHQFDRLDAGLLESLSPEMLGDGPDAPAAVWLGEAPPALAAIELVQRAPEAGALELLARGALDSGINLATGEFASGDRLSARRHGLRAALLAVAAGVLFIAGPGVEVVTLKREQARLDAEIEARFEALFPDIETLARPRAQAERALQARAAGHDRFLALMARAVPVFAGAGALAVERVGYDGERLELALSVPGMADIEALQRQLGAAGLDAQLGDWTVQGERMRARLTIRPEAPR